MYIETVPNRSSPPAVLLRESFREDGKVKKRTLANLSALPEEAIGILRAVLKGQKFIPADQLVIDQSLPHGHVLAVTGTMHALQMSALFGGNPCRELDLVLAMIAARVLSADSKLATSRFWNSNTLGETFGVAGADKEELYRALDWLLAQQPAVEKALAKRHLDHGSLILYDLTSTYVEGTCCPLADYGYSRDHRPDRMQIEFGLVTDAEGRPIAVEVFQGNTADPATLAAQIAKLKDRFGLQEVIVVGDRGMVTQTRIDEVLKPAGCSWITALRHDTIRKLTEGPLQMGLFDERNWAEIQSDLFPGERLIACRNPRLTEEEGRKRQALLERTEAGLEKVRQLVEKGRIKECGVIGRQVERAARRYGMAKHFQIQVEDGVISFQRNEASISEESALDGLYVIRSNLPAEALDAPEVVRQYKTLGRVEKAFRVIKSGLEVRPIYHHLADRVRAHIFLCMLAYYVEWEMRSRLAPLLYAEEATPAERQSDPVARLLPSQESLRKTGTRQSKSGFTLHSFSTLLQDLSSLVRNRCSLLQDTKHPVTFFKFTQPTPFQMEAFRLLGIPCTQ